MVLQDVKEWVEVVEGRDLDQDLDLGMGEQMGVMGMEEEGMGV